MNRQWSFSGSPQVILLMAGAAIGACRRGTLATVAQARAGDLGTWSSCWPCARTRSTGGSPPRSGAASGGAKFEERVTLEGLDFTASNKIPAAALCRGFG